MSRRGAFLLLFGGIWAAIGWGILTVPPSPVQEHGLAPLLLVADYALLGWLWLATGAVAVLSGFCTRPPLDRWGFYALMVPTILWSASYVVTAAREASPRFAIAALVYSALSVAVGIVSGGVEPPAHVEPRNAP